MKNPSTTEANRYWRSAEERAGDPSFQTRVDREFLDDAPDTNVTRRGFLGIMGAAAALAGLAGCSRPVSRILPYSKMPENLVPGVPQSYATTWGWRGAAEGLLVTSYEGRPTKIEGNPQHPVNRGTTDLTTQALVLSLYDPDRAAAVKHDGAESTWRAFRTWVKEERKAWSADGGAGLRFLAPLTSSPAEMALRKQLETEFPNATWHVWEPVNRDNELAGAELAFGRAVRTHTDYAQADVILSLDSDFMGAAVNSVAAARGFSDGRRVTSETDDMNRLYAVESSFTVTGSMADHRVPLTHGRVAEFAMALAQKLASAHRISLDGVEASIPSASDWTAEQVAVLDALAHDLAANRGRCVITAGRTQPAEVHALVHALNGGLGAVGPVIRYTDEPQAPNSDQSLASLVGALESASVRTLFVLGGNPVYDTPGDIDFAALMAKAATTVRLSLYEDESSAGTSWFLPEAHPLECWGDARAYDGTHGIQQPLIAPLHQGRSTLEVLDLLLGRRSDGDSGHGIVLRESGSGANSSRWDRILHDGLVPDSAYREVAVTLRGAGVAGALRNRRPAPAVGGETLEITFREDPKLYDGRFANLAWLQEVPDPMTKMTWDNPALIGPATARRLGVETGDMVRVKAGDRSLEIPVWVQPGHADHSLTLFLGYGRTAAGRVGDGVGFDVNPLRRSLSPNADYGATVEPTGTKVKLASTQEHWVMEDRPLAREGTLEHYREHPDFVEHMEESFGDVSIYLDREYDFDKGYQWGMSIDLNTCHGCNACVVACQSENNIPSVGKDQVLRGREMHWIRIDRYFVGDEENPHTVQQPLPCQQCENAPCEAVCPVNATAHNSEGMNDMVYNRCIGTRYCANNCPYKVRRFNFYDYNDGVTEVGKMQKNPNVTVRMRGVMEKCTYCVQRVNRARIDAKLEDRSIRDGDVVTACQQVCPTHSIEFGNINDPESRVAKARAENRDYAMLAFINTKPRTTYRARIRNPNPELEHHS